MRGGQLEMEPVTSQSVGLVTTICNSSFCNYDLHTDADTLTQTGDDLQLAALDHRLYSDRTEHFCGRGPQILMKLLEGGPYMKKIVSSPSEPFLVIRVCQKCQKIKKHEKPGF